MRLARVVGGRKSGPRDFYSGSCGIDECNAPICSGAAPPQVVTANFLRDRWVRDALERALQRPDGVEALPVPPPGVFVVDWLFDEAQSGIATA
jgi:hypothetical protein